MELLKTQMQFKKQKEKKMKKLFLLMAALALLAVPLSTAIGDCDCEDETCITLEILPYCEIEWDWMYDFGELEGGEGTATECVSWTASANYEAVITLDDTDLPLVGDWSDDWTDVFFGPGETSGTVCLTFDWDIYDPAGYYDGSVVLCLSEDDY